MGKSKRSEKSRTIGQKFAEKIQGILDLGQKVAAAVLPKQVKPQYIPVHNKYGR